MKSKVALSSAAFLDRWPSYDWLHQVTLDAQAPFDQVVVKTRNNAYEIVIVSPDTCEVLVRGGRKFPKLTAARLVGSSLGGSLIKLGAINVGFCMEFITAHDGLVVTSAVESITVVCYRDAAVDGAVDIDARPSSSEDEDAIAS